MGTFRERIAQEWGRRGFGFFEESTWSSGLQQEDLQRLRSFLTTNGFDNVDISLVRPISESSRVKSTQYYDTSGQCIVIQQGIPIPIGSNNLKVTLAFDNSRKQCRMKSQRDIVISAIRLVFGVSSARELISTGDFSLEDTDGQYFSETGFASNFDTQGINRFDSPPIEAAELHQIPEEAALLLDTAFSQPYPRERFILMWLASEAIINSLPGSKANGEKRKHFFKTVLQSEIVNEEMFRLFKLRSEVFKEGKFRDTKFDEECWSLYSALQLLIMRECPQRREFLKGYEAFLSSRH